MHACTNIFGRRPSKHIHFFFCPVGIVLHCFHSRESVRALPHTRTKVKIIFQMQKRDICYDAIKFAWRCQLGCVCRYIVAYLLRFSGGHLASSIQRRWKAKIKFFTSSSSLANVVNKDIESCLCRFWQYLDVSMPRGMLVYCCMICNKTVRVGNKGKVRVLLCCGILDPLKWLQLD